MKNIKICKIGYFNHSMDIEKLKKWESKYFKITSIDTVACIKVDHFSDESSYPSSKIKEDVGDDENGIDIKIAIIDQPLDDNYYMHRLDNKKAVISIFPVVKILREEKIPLENYLIRCIYEIVVFAYEGLGSVDKNIYLIPHHETRSCLFDMNVFIERVIYSSVKPTICNECKSRLERKTLPDNFVKNIEKELKKINRPLYYRIENQVKKRPFFYLILTAIIAVLLNIFSNMIYDYLKSRPFINKKVDQIETVK
jgi:hypothetical protein